MDLTVTACSIKFNKGPSRQNNVHESDHQLIIKKTQRPKCPINMTGRQEVKFTATYQRMKHNLVAPVIPNEAQLGRKHGTA